MARVPYLDKSQAAPKVAELFERLEENGQQVLNIYRAAGHASALAPDFFRLGNKILFKTKLDPKLRELAILRVGYLAQAPYEYTKHEQIGRKAGLGEEQIADLRNWARSEAYSPIERAVLQYTDEVARGHRASDDTFAAVRGHLDDERVVELTITIGFYEMICRLLESLQVDIEDDFKPF